jgi:tetratricopeptide (TPR) repeat protein
VFSGFSHHGSVLHHGTLPGLNQTTAPGLAHHGNDFQQARSLWAQAPRSVSSRHAALQSQIGHSQSGHLHNSWNGNANGRNNGNWNRGYQHQDWRSFHQRHYWPYYGWYRGFWFPGYGWNSYWNSYPGWGSYGLTPWGINRSAWTFGYWGYSNPYCQYGSYGYSSPYNYSLPLVTTQPGYSFATPADSDVLPAGITADGKAAFDASLAAFRTGDFSSALGWIDQAIQQMPSDAVAHEFRGLVLFALGRYEESAEAVYAVLAVGPGWDWETMITLYPDPEMYTAQLRALESWIGTHPDSSAGRFLLAYHYMRCGHNDSARDQLKQVLALSPGQKVATDLLTMMDGPDSVKSLPGAGPAMVPPSPDEVTSSPVAKEQLIGHWHAEGPDGTTFGLDLNSDGSFEWVFTRAGTPEKVNGVWEMDGAQLALQPDAGGTLLATITTGADGGFSFRMQGAEPGDSGLNFLRNP